MTPNPDFRRILFVGFLLCSLAFLQFAGGPYAHAATKRLSGVLTGPWTPPVTPPLRLTRAFIAPESVYGAGHRGIDLTTTDGAVILAPADGSVEYAGSVAGKPVLAIGHIGGLKSTYEPACTLLAVGTPVRAGQVVGSVCGKGYASHCAPMLCLHFAAKNARGYLSPQFLMGQLAPSQLIA